MGKEFTASIPALNNKELKFKVNFIKAEADFATWRATKASGSFDLKSFELRALPVDKIENLRPGMSVIVEWDKI